MAHRKGRVRLHANDTRPFPTCPPSPSGIELLSLNFRLGRSASSVPPRHWAVPRPGYITDLEPSTSASLNLLLTCSGVCFLFAISPTFYCPRLTPILDQHFGGRSLLKSYIICANSKRLIADSIRIYCSESADITPTSHILPRIITLSLHTLCTMILAYAHRFSYSGRSRAGK